MGHSKKLFFIVCSLFCFAGFAEVNSSQKQFSASDFSWKGPQYFNKENGILEIRGKGIVESAPVPISPQKQYRFNVSSFASSAGFFRMGVRLYDKKMRLLSIPDSYQTLESSWDTRRRHRRFWLPLHVKFDTSADAVYAKLWFNIYSSGELKFKDIRISEVDSHPAPELDSLPDGPYTRDSLMLPGPDGYLYPNFSFAGLTKDWKVPETIFRVEDFGACADDKQDDTDALEKAIEAAGKAGGGTILFGKGTYRITRKVVIPYNRVVLRGAGPDVTHLELGLPDNGIGLFYSGSTTARRFHIVFPPEKVQRLHVKIDGKHVETISRDKLLSGRFLYTPSPSLCKLLLSGEHLLQVEIEYPDGKKSSHQERMQSGMNLFGTGSLCYFVFCGRFPPFKLIPAAPIKRGEKRIVLRNSDQFKKGELVGLRKHLTDQARLYSGGYVPGWNVIDFAAEITNVDGKNIEIAQPVRLDYSAEEKPSLIRIDPIRESGIENMTLIHTGKQDELGLGSVNFVLAFNCRASFLTVRHPGTYGICGSWIKNTEFLNCKVLNPRSRNKAGNLAYAGFDRAWDCLVRNMETDGMRHAPLMNWCSSGNVITGGTFRNSDAQFHSGWCHDNLIENCRILDGGASVPEGSYGWALFAVPYDDGGHGSIGPRNVLYNCDTISRSGGVYMGGPNQDWSIMYNRIITGGPGVLERIGSNRNCIVGNRFILKNPRMPMVFQESLKSENGIVKGNSLYGGNGRILMGAGSPLLKDNHVFPYKMVPRPKAPVPSLYDWQKNNSWRNNRNG